MNLKSVIRLLLPSIIIFFMTSLFTGLFAGNSFSDKFKHALELSNKGKYEDALPLLKELTRENPSDDRVLRTLGFIYMSLKQYAEAIDSFERSVQIKPSEESYYSLGLLYEGMTVEPRQKGNEIFWLKKARDAWEAYLKLKPENVRKVESAKVHLEHLKQDLRESRSER